MPGAEFGEIGREIGNRWEKLSSQAKDEYKNRAIQSVLEAAHFA
jgi:hypothetical protein